MAAKKTTEQKKKEQPKGTVEEAFEKIDQAIEALEDEDVSLEDAFSHFQKGMEYVKYCEGLIDKVEKKVQQITTDGEESDFE